MISTGPDILAGLTPTESDRVLALGVPLELRSGEELFRLGAAAERLFAIQRGRIKLMLPMRVRGHEQYVQVEEGVPGQSIGWSALIPPHHYTLTALAPLETEVIAFSRDVLQEHFAAHPAVGYTICLNLSTIVGKRLHLFQAMWLREMQRTVEVRCA